MNRHSEAEIQEHLAAPVRGQLDLFDRVAVVKALFTRPRGTRFQRRRGQALPAGVVYVGRPTLYGNPFTCGGAALEREQVVGRYRAYLLDHPDLVEAVRTNLGGLDLACWCPLDGGACHAEVLLDLAATPGVPAAAVLLAV